MTNSTIRLSIHTFKVITYCLSLSYSHIYMLYTYLQISLHFVKQPLKQFEYLTADLTLRSPYTSALLHF